ncbi:helix-turn-helix domain-containing protein [Streptomyces sp. NPDC020802]|uniref:helix-turn-helix domain-containing protein n=1 Tax=Streptomyces sp. NPDC020802 TaxID=3365094 RepID=UPI0037907D6F
MPATTWPFSASPQLSAATSGTSASPHRTPSKLAQWPAHGPAFTRNGVDGAAGDDHDVGAEQGEWNEFAKDVAAMANARGGLLVYGVRNDRVITGIDPDAINAEHLYKWLRANTQPFVAGVDTYTRSSADGSTSVLVVDVPASSMAPHFILGTSPREKQLHASQCRSDTRTTQDGWPSTRSTGPTETATPDRPRPTKPWSVTLSTPARWF